MSVTIKNGGTMKAMQEFVLVDAALSLRRALRQKTDEHARNKIGPNTAAWPMMNSTRFVEIEQMRCVEARIGRGVLGGDETVLDVPDRCSAQTRQRDKRRDDTAPFAERLAHRLQPAGRERQTQQEIEHGVFRLRAQADRDAQHDRPAPSARLCHQPPHRQAARAPRSGSNTASVEMRPAENHTPGSISQAEAGPETGPGAVHAAAQARTARSPRSIAQSARRAARPIPHLPKQRRGRRDRPGDQWRLGEIAPIEDARPNPILGFVEIETERA